MLVLNIASIIFIFHSLRKDCTEIKKIEFDLYQTVICGIVYTIFTFWPARKIQKKEKEL